MTQRTYQFVQVDVFTDRVFRGNALAVFLDARGLSDAEMQQIGTEMNLSETVFIFPAADPAHAFKLRIFTPAAEIPFAGHPTIGTAHVVASRGLVPPGTDSFVFEENVGPIPVRIEAMPGAQRFWMMHPPASFGPELSERAALAGAIRLVEDDLLPGMPIVVGSTGTPFLFIPLRDAATVDRAALDVSAFQRIPIDQESFGVFVFAPHPERGPNHVYSRMFAPHTFDIPEDPATGSASGPLGAYLVRHGLVTGEGEVEVISDQGVKTGRHSVIRIRMTVHGGEARVIEVGGAAVDVLEGVLTLPVTTSPR